MRFPWIGFINKVQSTPNLKDRTMYSTTTLSTEQRARLHVLARRQAQLLRRAAISDFWHTAYHLAAHALRVVRHLPQRLAPHAKYPSGV